MTTRASFQVSASLHRRKIGLRYAYTSGKVATSKATTSRPFESGLERDFYQLLEFDADVVTYEPQPVTLNWCDGAGRSSRYTPDTLVHFAPAMGRRPIMYEVKPQAVLRAEWLVLRPRFKAALKWCRAKGYDFRIVRDVDIQTPLLKNARFLLGFIDARMQIGGATALASRQGALLSMVPTGKTMMPRQLLEATAGTAAEQAELIPYMWNLVAHGRLIADLEQPLTMTSSLWRPAYA